MKSKKILISILFLAGILSVNIYLRSFTVDFPQLRGQAEKATEAQILQSAHLQVEENFPEYAELAKQELVKSLVLDHKRKNRNAIGAKIEAEYNFLKDNYQDASGSTYLMELDCWKWARYVDNVVRLGHPGDKVIGGRQWDALMFAPKGRFMEWNHFLYYFSAFLYKVFDFFKPL
ncbi:STT3 domain-containing protein, partial [Candidatus Omnitrophota bacterium]